MVKVLMRVGLKLTAPLETRSTSTTPCDSWFVSRRSGESQMSTEQKARTEAVLMHLGADEAVEALDAVAALLGSLA